MNIPTILIADDEEPIHTTLRDYLSRRIECNVLTAKDGEEAINYIKEKSCDILVLDIRMPKKSGMHVLDELKHLGKQIDAIVITGWASNLLIEECKKRGVEVLNKPFTYDKLFVRIEQLLKKRDLFILKKQA